MVVLLSRARVAMYLVGNGSYFSPENDRLPPHWAATIKSLSSPTPSDTLEGTAQHFDGVRFGPEIPLCCPLHRPLSTVYVKGGESVSVKCSAICDFRLRCGHECSLPCHYSTPDAHNTKCEVLLDCPCVDHPAKIKCFDLMAGGGYSVEEALERYCCKKKVSVTLPCGHSDTLTCANERDFALKKKPWPVCKQKALGQIVLPCKHVLRNVLCYEFEGKKGTVSSHLCKEEVDHLPSCGHKKLVKCYLDQEYQFGQMVYRCSKQVTLSLPRCRHKVEMACSEMGSLHSWEGTSVKEEGVVEEGNVYGPLDHRCDKEVKFQRKCGHQEIKRCSDAFQMCLSGGMSPCSVPLQIVKNSCGHTVSVPCSTAHKYEIVRGGNVREQKAVEGIVEGSELSGFILDPNCAPMIPCDHDVEVKRKCGHSILIKCDQAKGFCEGRVKLPQCDFPIKGPSPLCFHLMDLPCWMKSCGPEWPPWPPEFYGTKAFMLLQEGSLRSDLSPPNFAQPAEFSKIKWKCKHQLKLLLPCGHSMTFGCNRALRSLGKNLPVCTETVVVSLSCGHEKKILCKNKDTPPKCTVLVERECWNYACCEQRKKVPCSTTVVTCDSETSKFVCDNKIENHSIPLSCKQGRPLFCPSCSVDSFREELQKLKIELEHPQPALSRDFFEFVCKQKGYRQAQSRGQTSGEFLLDCLKTHKTLLKEKLASSYWEIFEEKPQIVPIFTIERDFIPKSTTFGFGTKVYPLVTEALRPHLEKCKGTGVTFLVGLAAVTCPLVNIRPVGIKQARGWAPKQRNRGHDCVWIAKDNYFVLWNNEDFNRPPILGVGTLSLGATVAKTFLSELERGEMGKKGEEWELLCPRKNKFVQYLPKDPSAGGISASDTVTDPALFSVLNRWCDRIFGKERRSRLKSLPPAWDGESLLTEGTMLPQNVIAKLSKKLQFLGGGPEEDEDPFQAINVLRSVGEGGFIHSSLFEGLENWTLSFEAEGRVKVEEYIDVLGQGDSMGHPLILYALALLVEEGSHLNTTPFSTPIAHSGSFSADDLEKFEGRSFFYHVFSRLYGQDLAKKWFSSLLPQNPSSSSCAKAKESAAEKWDRMKREKKCCSEAMDELCGLVGLEKVKEKALSFFEIFVKTCNFSEDLRSQLGKKSLNFAFLGNPGTGFFS